SASPRLNPQSIKPVRPWLAIVRDYVSVLHTALQGSPPPEGVNEYTTACKSAVMLISEMLVQDFATVMHRLPILLNYVLLHLPARLQENSVRTYLLHAFVEGYIGMLHRRGVVGNDLVDEKLRRVLVLIDTATCHIDWESDRIRYIIIFFDNQR